MNLNIWESSVFDREEQDLTETVEWAPVPRGKLQNGHESSSSVWCFRAGSFMLLFIWILMLSKSPELQRPQSFVWDKQSCCCLWSRHMLLFRGACIVKPVNQKQPLDCSQSRNEDKMTAFVIMLRFNYVKHQCTLRFMLSKCGKHYFCVVKYDKYQRCLCHLCQKLDFWVNVLLLYLKLPELHASEPKKTMDPNKIY